MMLPARLRAAFRPLFVQLFAVMLATAGLVQAINFGLLLVMPDPPPRVDSLARIASALKSGDAMHGTYVVERWDRLPPGARTQRDVVLGQRLATMLGVPATQIRVHAKGRHRDVGFAYERTDDPAARLRASGMAREEGDIVFGPIAAAVQLPDGHWRSVRPVAPWIAPWQWQALGWLLAAMAAVALPAWWLARRLTQPLRRFAEAAERLGADPQAPPVPLSGPGELADTARAFNDMQIRLNRYVADRMTMIAAIAHDLRTPLMRMAMRLPAARADLRDALQGDIDEMDQRLIAVTALVRDMSRPARRQRVDLYSIAESVVSDAADGGAQAVLLPGARTIIEGDQAALKAMIGNLVANACRYAGSAEVEVAAHGDGCSVEVRDRGPGVDAQDLERLFDPFVRGEASRNSETGGMGLGLASVRAIARAHGGDATLALREGGGLVARVTLPGG